VAVELRSEGKSSKNEETTLVFSFTTMLQHTGRFLVKDFLTKIKEQRWKFLHNVLTWFELNSIFSSALTSMDVTAIL